VPPQNLVDRTMVDVSALGSSLPTPMLHLLYVLLATARSSPNRATSRHRRIVPLGAEHREQRANLCKLAVHIREWDL
jgi:hypothetical protein